MWEVLEDEQSAQILRITSLNSLSRIHAAVIECDPSSVDTWPAAGSFGACGTLVKWKERDGP